MTKQKTMNNLEKGKKANASVEKDILEGLAEFSDVLEKGEVTKRLTCRQIKLTLVSTIYSPELVKKTRRSLGISQTLFARFLGVSPKTVRSWEQGLNCPNPMACRFMDEIRQDPSYWIERLKEAAIPKTPVEPW